MTFCIKNETVGNHYFYIEQPKFSSAYVVGVCEITSGICGYPISERTYATIKQANRRYRDLISAYVKKG